MSDVPIVPAPPEAIINEPPQPAAEPTNVAGEPAKAAPEPLKASDPNPAGVPKPPNAEPKSADGDFGSDMSREVRLGLVLYGGVSLAIYMNGVANEFFNAVRGGGIYALIKALTDSDVVVDIVSGASAGGVNGIFLAFALCNQKDFAGFARLWRNQGDVSRLLRDPWEDPDDCHSLFDSKGYYQSKLQEAFETVFQNPLAPKSSRAQLPSEFNEVDLFITGSDVEGRLFTTFDDLGQTIDLKDHRAVFHLKHRRCRKEPFNPCFETDLKARAQSQAPSAADEAAEKKIAFESLAKLARLTSCFPGAFEPVQITRPDAKSKEPTADDRLRLWGGLDHDASFKRGQDKFFVDGGVLNNKPFTSTLDEILYRLADSDVERFLIYVEPDPERFNPPPERLVEPEFSATILDSLVSLPGYQSIASDLQELAEHNSQVERYERLTAQFRAEVSGASEEVLKLEDSAGYGLYVRARLGAITERVARGVLREDGVDALLQTRRQKEAACMLLSEFDQLAACMEPEVQETILRQFDMYFPQRRLFEAIHRIKMLLYPIESTSQPENCRAEMKDLRAREQMNIDRARDKREPYTRLWIALNHQIELLQIVQTAAEQMLDQARMPWPRPAPAGSSGPPAITGADVWRIVEVMVQKLLDPGWLWARVARCLQAANVQIRDLQLNYRDTWPVDAAPGTDSEVSWGSLSPAQLQQQWLSQDWLSALNDVLQARSKDICAALLKVNRDSAPADFIKAVQALEGSGSATTALPEIEACSLRIFNTLIAPDDPVRNTYDRFQALDARLYPMDVAGGLRSKSRINLLRISPFDAQKGYSQRRIDEKVTGIQFFHFGAFFKRSWRSNDILWGRVDAACQLTECLLKKDRLRQTGADQNLRRKVRRCLGLDSPGSVVQVAGKDVFPNLSAAHCAQLRDWLDRLLSDQPGVRAQALDEFDNKPDGSGVPWQTRLIMAEQAEIINEDLEGVIVDAAAEQMEWNQYLVPGESGQPSKPVKLAVPYFQFQGGAGTLDSTVITVSSAELAKTAAAAIKDKPAFFFKEYAVGSQELMKDVPTVILLEIVAQAMLVLRNCVLTNLGDGAEKVKAARAFRFCVDLPLKVFYNYVLWWRRSPAAHRYTQALIFLLACAILAIGFVWRDDLFFVTVLSQQATSSFQWNSFGYVVIVAALVVVAALIAFWKGSSRLLRVMGVACVAGIAGALIWWTSGSDLKSWLTTVLQSAPALPWLLLLAGLAALAFVAGRWSARRRKDTVPANNLK